MKDYGIPTPRNPSPLSRQPSERNLTSTVNFQFVLPKVPDCTFFCQSVSFPTISCPPTEYAYGTSTLRVPSMDYSHTDLSFTFLVNEDLSNYKEMQKWFRTMSAFVDGFAGVLSARDWMSEQGQLIVLSNRKNPIARLTFRGLFPTSLSSFDFDNADSEARQIVATATMGFTYMDREEM